MSWSRSPSAQPACKAVFAAAAHEFLGELGGGGATGFVFDEFQADDESTAAHVAEFFVFLLEFSEPRQHMRADGEGVFGKFLFFHDVDDGE